MFRKYRKRTHLAIYSYYWSGVEHYYSAQNVTHVDLGLSTVRRYMIILSIVRTESGLTSVTCACVEGEGVGGRDPVTVVTVEKNSCMF